MFKKKETDILAFRERRINVEYPLELNTGEVNACRVHVSCLKRIHVAMQCKMVRRG